MTRRRDYVRDEQFHGKITTREVLQRELDIVSLAQHRMQQYEPLSSNYQTANHSLDDEQRKAVEHILSSRDFVTLFRGGAGTGKSFTLREVKAGLIKRRVIQFKSSRHNASRSPIWNETALSGAQTVSALLAQNVPCRAGRLSWWMRPDKSAANKCCDLLRSLRESSGRVILSGDTHQHGAVEASDALRAIEKYSGLGYAELTNIRRQNPDAAKTKAERQWLEQYKLAVNEAQQGKLGASFDRLDKHGAIVSCTLADQQQKLTEHFLGTWSRPAMKRWSSHKAGRKFTRSMSKCGWA